MRTCILGKLYYSCPANQLFSIRKKWERTRCSSNYLNDLVPGSLRRCYNYPVTVVPMEGNGILLRSISKAIFGFKSRMAQLVVHTGSYSSSPWASYKDRIWETMNEVILLNLSLDWKQFNLSQKQIAVNTFFKLNFLNIFGSRDL